MKAAFLNNEIWVLTFGGGFQRANVYKEKIPEPVRKEFREALRDKIEALVAKDYHTKVSEEVHVKNIQSIVDFSNKEQIQGYTIPINFGVAQKLFNLYLKYLWCSDKLATTPVHFPVDRLIQTKLNEEAKEAGIQRRELKAWTQFEDEKEYLEVIRFAEKVQEKSTKYQDVPLAEMELEMFNRR
ncbi:hypothetical protein SAMN05660776_2892 [Salegentibacter holothuriorum]|uniref:Uncharacterized protein n=1 Tax=Salegentibacter holothuriorum TaxID=241145 RepID=A0A1T5DZD0_9FLAO|nr:hypothetical protein [Salegentibacter holothuriorum]SKB76939.1 hypothetical protein SAMN05660776_2892 [Salegentibacter holothuriorum]